MLSLLLVYDVHENNEFQIAHYNNVIVHFDLKGAPPKVAYLKQVLELIKHNGATGWYRSCILENHSLPIPH